MILASSNTMCDFNITKMFNIENFVIEKPLYIKYSF